MELKKTIFQIQAPSFHAVLILFLVVLYLQCALLFLDNGGIFYDDGQVSLTSPLTSHTFTLATIIITMQIAVFVHYQTTLNWTLREFDTKIKLVLQTKDIETVAKEIDPITRLLEIPRISSITLSAIFCCIMSNYALAPFSQWAKSKLVTSVEVTPDLVTWIVNLIIVFSLSVISFHMTSLAFNPRQDLKKFDQTVDTLQKRYRYAKLFGNLDKEISGEIYSQATHINERISNKVSTLRRQLGEAQRSQWMPRFIIFLIFAILNLFFIGSKLIFSPNEGVFISRIDIASLLMLTIASYLVFDISRMICNWRRSQKEKIRDVAEAPLAESIGLLASLLVYFATVLIGELSIFVILLAVINILIVLCLIKKSEDYTKEDWDLIKRELQSTYTDACQSQRSVQDSRKPRRNHSKRGYHFRLGSIVCIHIPSKGRERSELFHNQEKETNSASPRPQKVIDNTPLKDSPLNMKLDDRLRRFLLVYENNERLLHLI